MAQRERPLSPFMHYRWQYTNTLSILHRITGVLLSVGFFVLVYWLSAVAGGPDCYARALACYHLLNGVRHLFFDMGVGFERATARRSARVVAVLAVVLAVVAWIALRHSLGGGA
jgi:succinate dehydrogenase / fumarate reductase, cytochrome b subunit